MARPKLPVKDVRNALVTIRMTRKQKVAIRQEAGRLSISEWILGLIFGFPSPKPTK